MADRIPFPTDSEEWFLEQLEKPEPPLDDLRTALTALAAGGGVSQADTRTRMLAEVLAGRGALEPALDFTELRAGWLPPGPESLGQIRADIRAMLGADTQRAALLDQAGFDQGLAPAEAARRAHALLGFTAGRICFDKTWGLGVIREVDHFQRRIRIDFEKKSGHTMTLAYAAEALRLPGKDHFLARFHRDPDALRAQARECPAEVVRLALSSFGPLTVFQLQDHVCPRIVPEAEWKPFWDAARKELKRDPRVALPAKRTDPLELRRAREEFGAEWYSELAAERDMKSLLERIEALREAGRRPPADAEARVLADRLAFVIKGAGARHPGWTARAVMLADHFACDPGVVDAAEQRKAWDRDDALLAAAGDLPARRVPEFLAFFAAHAGGDPYARLAALLPRMEAGLLQAAMDVLMAADREPDCAETVRQWVANRKAGVEILLWIIRRPEIIRDWALGAPADIARQMIAAMELDLAGERLKAQNQLRERFVRPDWLQTVVGDMNDDQQREFVIRLRETTAWPPLERQAMVGRLVKQFPFLEEHLRREASAAPAERRKVPLTSSRSYRERQEQLRKIVHEDIPRNSREIALARSYGDLRENFEYKAAKDMQALLMRRQAEIEQQLRSVQPSDFAGFPAAVAGLATRIALALDGGREERYCILGVWDRDEALGIISSDSRLAQAVEGRRAGETLEVPGEDGPRSAVLRSVEPLPADVLAWAKATHHA